ncbi:MULTISPECIES: phosphonate ABC transporter, permease protein PhnE [Alphaproteobacteria]|uniref:Phosphonate ABC transporter, permease protein PhnE n=2 Tax=Alphaproteobacteria TaxID=28211 RepID=A0A512HIU8_9HYPH|nr:MULTISPECIES: phosphonate ABC transporter, permease protein PhnE [Alphaproteobacteria]GEO85378.1 phosphonate ABC transporter, permease protein PhnE [Ciceribacter naphthalenivorans]GLR21017.1 phosphonate ABC transporter, permease protein PhnE [Ciceribacter naphthalenivorans]GLT03873.1 phosphonate ABC transporter, permease protein PhnE [Sphingomonas psychrolutea]
MNTLTTAELAAVAARHPHLLQPSFWMRFRFPLIGGATVLYLVFCWWFFAIGQVLGSANWPIAGTYLADWISYEVRPDIEIARDGTMQISYPRYDPLGPNPNPDWLSANRETVTRTIEIPGTTSQTPTQPKSSFSFVAPSNSGTQEEATQARTQTRTEEVVTHAVVAMNSTDRIDISGKAVEVYRGADKLGISLSRNDGVTADRDLPDWATQRQPGEKIVLAFGFSGWAEVRDDVVKVHKRFLGWENFFFDIDSPFFGMSFTKVVGLITVGPRLDPARSNLMLALDNILYNPSWQHLDVWTKLLQTIVMAFVGTLFAMIVAFPLSFIAARNITRNRPVNQLIKRFFDFQRSVDMFIWALFFTRAFGPGPLAGISAIFFTDTGTLGKLYAEALENIDDKQREGVKSVGAQTIAVQRFGVLPQVLPVFASQALYFWESNTRSATIIGAVGAGGIGLKLWEAMRTNADWENVAYMVVLILIVVFIFDGISNALRSRLMGNKH